MLLVDIWSLLLESCLPFIWNEWLWNAQWKTSWKGNALLYVSFLLKYRDTKISEVRIEDQVVNGAMYIATPNLEAVPLLETCNTR